jgi:hypothetical protein
MKLWKFIAIISVIAFILIGLSHADSEIKNTKFEELNKNFNMTNNKLKSSTNKTKLESGMSSIKKGILGMDETGSSKAKINSTTSNSSFKEIKTK